MSIIIQLQDKPNNLQGKLYKNLIYYAISHSISSMPVLELEFLLSLHENEKFDIKDNQDISVYAGDILIFQGQIKSSKIQVSTHKKSMYVTCYNTIIQDELDKFFYNTYDPTGRCKRIEDIHKHYYHLVYINTINQLSNVTYQMDNQPYIITSSNISHIEFQTHENVTYNKSIQIYAEYHFTHSTMRKIEEISCKLEDGLDIDTVNNIYRICISQSNVPIEYSSNSKIDISADGTSCRLTNISINEKQDFIQTETYTITNSVELHPIPTKIINMQNLPAYEEIQEYNPDITYTKGEYIQYNQLCYKIDDPKDPLQYKIPYVQKGRIKGTFYGDRCLIYYKRKMIYESIYYTNTTMTIQIHTQLCESIQYLQMITLYKYITVTHQNTSHTGYIQSYTITNSMITIVLGIQDKEILQKSKQYYELDNIDQHFLLQDEESHYSTINDNNIVYTKSHPHCVIYKHKNPNTLVAYFTNYTKQNIVFSDQARYILQ